MVPMILYNKQLFSHPSTPTPKTLGTPSFLLDERKGNGQDLFLFLFTNMARFFSLLLFIC